MRWWEAEVRLDANWCRSAVDIDAPTKPGRGRHLLGIHYIMPANSGAYVDFSRCLLTGVKGSSPFNTASTFCIANLSNPLAVSSVPPAL